MDGYRITEVARRSGFPASTLRYYDDIGLVRPAGRTPAGYRVYDDRSLERLSLIDRAKQLGCTLDEISELIAAFDQGACSPVQTHFESVLAARVLDVEAQIAELQAFACELRDAQARLRPAPGLCDATCGCLSQPVQRS